MNSGYLKFKEWTVFPNGNTDTGTTDSHRKVQMKTFAQLSLLALYEQPPFRISEKTDLA
jgi:hypothetical protein